MVSSTRRLLALLAALLLLPAATLAYKDVQFFVIGDWGRQGTSNQKNVAKLMGQVAKSMKPSFIVSTGKLQVHKSYRFG
jgi:carbohydrate-selective porin OprB